MAWKKKCCLLVTCLAVAHVGVILFTPVDPRVTEEQWCDDVVQYAELSEFEVLTRVHVEGFAAGHALARALIQRITEHSLRCRSTKYMVRIAVSLYNLKLLKEQLELEVYQQASCPVPTCVGAGRFILYQRPVG